MSLSIRRSLPTLGALGLLGPMGNDIFLPAMPIMAAWFLAPGTAIQFALGAMSIGMASGQLAVGVIADRVGRRGPMLLGALLATASAFGAALAPNVTVLTGATFLLGLGAASGMVVGRAVVSDIATGAEARRAFAILGALTGIGPVLGPLLGTLLLSLWGWQSTFITLGIMGAAVTIAVLIQIPETLPVELRHSNRYREYPRLMLAILRTPSYLVNASFIWIGFAMIFGYISASSFVVQSILGWTAAQYALVFAINGASMALVGVLTGVLAHRVGARTLLGTAIALQLCAAVMLLASVVTATISPFLLLPAMWCIVVGMGLIYGPATSNALTEMQGRSGTALALMGAIQFAIGGVVAPIVGLAGELSIVPLSALAVVCAGTNTLTFALGRRYTGERNSPNLDIRR